MRTLFLLLLALLVAGCAASGTAAPTPTATVAPLVPERIFPAGAVSSLDAPTVLDAAEANERIGPLAMVLGVVRGGEARAYPMGMLSRREIVNDTLGGEPITVTFCPLCNSAVVVSRVVEGQTLTFDHSGTLLDETLVMVDRESGSLWPQSRLAAIAGPLAGKGLPLLSANQMTWEDWLAANPTTTLATDGARPVAAPTLVPGFTAERPSVAGYVLGVASAAGARAYPLDAVAAGVVNDEPPGGPPLLLVATGEPGEVSAWQRVVEGQTLTLRMEGDALVDEETGSTWDPATLSATEGPLAGAALAPAETMFTHWLGWVDLYPQSEVWGR